MARYHPPPSCLSFPPLLSPPSRFFISPLRHTSQIGLWDLGNFDLLRGSSRARMSRCGKVRKPSYGWMTGNDFDSLPLPSGVPVSMCFCGNPCKVAKSDAEDMYRQRYWMCSNFAFESTLRQRRINKMTPPLLCDFEQWIDTEIKLEDKEEMQEMLCWEAEKKETMEKRRREEAAEKEHKEEEERRCVAANREEREKKLERAR
uniref:Zinc finger GRF-type domain-containing protein n=1 Tax=Setaria viridis TaxID=4556 RepID=A0A4U6VDP2_SETVI|nr:hypothetical protein SEVIR_3G206501v2 [Setaria viridis]